jgi:hypothetical protein
MTDWQVGDLAVCVDDGPCPYYGRDPQIVKGGVYTVADVLPNNGLLLEGIQSQSSSGGYAMKMFRKIRPDQHEACEPEFVTLIKRVSCPVSIDLWEDGLGHE